MGIMNNTRRHWRATQLADVMDPFTLKEALHRATMPFEYVHSAESRWLEREEEVDKLWRERVQMRNRSKIKLKRCACICAGGGLFGES